MAPFFLNSNEQRGNLGNFSVPNKPSKLCLPPPDRGRHIVLVPSFVGVVGVELKPPKFRFYFSKNLTVSYFIFKHELFIDHQNISHDFENW